MAYIGSTPTTQSFIAGTDYFNGTGSQVAFTLSRSVNSVNDIEVIVNNVEQIPSGYSVSGTTLTFSAAPSAGTSNVYVRYLSTTNLSLAIPAGTSATFNTVTATTLAATNLSYTGTLTGGTGVVNLGSGQVYKDASGNVGIGTSSPAAKLSVNQTGIAVNIGDISSAPSSNVNTFVGPATSALAGVNGDLVLCPRTSTTASILFYTGNGTSAERARIDSSGNLLVGTTSANGRVSSTPKAGFNPAGSSGSWATASAISVSGGFGGGVSWVDGSGGYCAWVDDGGNDFNIAGGLVANVVGNGVFLNGYAATAWSARSDERLKDKFEPITDAVNKVGSLRAVTGVYKNFPEDRQAFLFAQDVQKVLPEAVSVADKKSPEQYLGLAYTQVIPLLVAAIQEQQTLITALTARITALESK